MVVVQQIFTALKLAKSINDDDDDDDDDFNQPPTGHNDDFDVTWPSNDDDFDQRMTTAKPTESRNESSRTYPRPTSSDTKTIHKTLRRVTNVPPKQVQQ